MGKNAQLAKLESKIAALEMRLEDQGEILKFIRNLAELPECTILYDKNGMRITSNPVEAARAFLEKISVPP